MNRKRFEEFKVEFEIMFFTPISPPAKRESFRACADRNIECMRNRIKMNTEQLEKKFIFYSLNLN